ncbi:MAG: nitrogenase component 1 [Velocimicrobium sp.]
MKEEFVVLEDIKSRSPFPIGLQYNAPARGVWNIVNIAMMLPESLIIFVCPIGCMRGVTLTAAQMGAMDRFCAIFVNEQDVLSGNGEQLIIEGVSEVLDEMEKTPRAVSIFTSCIDQFLGTDHKLVFDTLNDKYKEVGFIECFMTPTMRKGALPPDPIMRKQMFHLLSPNPKRKKTVNFIGNHVPLPQENEFRELILEAGYKVLDLANCNTFDEYLEMQYSEFNIMIHPNGNLAMDDLTKRLAIKEIRIPLSYEEKEITENYVTLSRKLGIKNTNEQMERLIMKREAASRAMEETQKLLQNTPIAIDYTMTMRPFGLAKLLVSHGFFVERIYAESCVKEEEEAFVWLKAHAKHMKWYYPMTPSMSVISRNGEESFLALGQIAAYFTNTKHFVNVVESDGMYGFHGVIRLMDAMREAFYQEKDTKQIIEVKALGCFNKGGSYIWSKL